MRPSPLLVLLLALLAGGGVWMARGNSPGAVGLVASAPGPAVELSAERLPSAQTEPGTLGDELLVSASAEYDSSARALVVTDAAHLPFIVDVTTKGGSKYGSKPEANVAFEIRLRSSLRDSAAVYSGVTDERGVARVELHGSQVPRTVSGNPRRMQGAVTQAGFLHDPVRVNSPWRPGTNFSLELIATRGATLRGRVVNSTGRGVSADLSFWTPSVELRSAPWSSAGTVCAGWDGSFEIHLPDSKRGTLLARKRGVGTGALHELDPGTNAALDDLLIVLRGEGVLRGRVRDARGAPVAGLPLQVRLASAPALEGEVGPGSDSWIEGFGSSLSMCVTDAAGEFAAHGLRSGSYHVQARLAGETSGYPLRLSTRALASGGTRHELFLTRPHLIVRVTDAEGQLIATPALRLGLGTDREREPGRVTIRNGVFSWPRQVEVLVVPCESSANGPRASGDCLPGWRASGREVGFDLQEDRSYLVGAIGPGFDGSMREVLVPAGSGRIEVLLAASRREDVFGSVLVNVIVDGQPLKPAVWFNFSIRSDSRKPEAGASAPDSDPGVQPLYTVTLRRWDTDTIVVKRPAVWPMPCTFEAPPGRYRVVVEASGSGPARGEAEAEVQITAGVPQTVELVFEP